MAKRTVVVPSARGRDDVSSVLERKIWIRQPDPTAQQGRRACLEEGAIKDMETNGKWEKNTRGTCQVYITPD